MPINNNILVNKFRSFISDKDIDKIKKLTSVTCQLFKPNYWTISIIFLFILFTIFDAQLYSWIEDKAGKILSFTYSTINQNAILNWYILLIIIILGSISIHYRLKDLYVSLNQVLIYIFTFSIAIYSSEYWLYSKTPLYRINYWHLIIALISIHLVATCFIIIKRYITALKERTLSQGFAVDTPDKDLLLDEEKSYWKNFCSRLLQTDISKDPFSVGIVGDWGSGKTTVLEAIRHEL